MIQWIQDSNDVRIPGHILVDRQPKEIKFFYPFYVIFIYLCLGISHSRYGLCLNWNSIYFVVKTLRDRDNLLNANQSITFFISLSIPIDIEFIIIMIMCSFSKENETKGPVKVVSSAYVINMNFSETLGISLTYKIQKKCAQDGFLWNTRFSTWYFGPNPFHVCILIFTCERIENIFPNIVSFKHPAYQWNCKRPYHNQH